MSKVNNRVKETIQNLHDGQNSTQETEIENMNQRYREWARQWNISLIWYPKGENRQNEGSTIFKEIKVKNF